MSKKKKVSSKPTAKKIVAKSTKKSSKTVTKVSVKKPEKKGSKKPIVSKKLIAKGNNKPAPKKTTPAKKVVKVVAKVAKKVQKTVVAKKSAPVKTVASKAPSKPVATNNHKPSPAPKPNKPAPPTTGTKSTVIKVGKIQVHVVGKSAVKEVRKEMPAPMPATKPSKQDDPKKNAAGKSLEVLAISNTIPVAKKNEISPSKIASISHSITNPIRKTDSYAIKPEKEPAGKFEMEFVLHSSSEMLYEFLSTASGLSEWFCDDLNIRNGIYTFIWDDQLQQARLLKTIDLHLVRFQWVDKTDGSYFEFKIQKDDLTNDIALIITDFADNTSERESSKLLWQSQIEKLRHVIGSIF